MSVIGRFAPTPSGPLHFGSLIAAVASYCDARAMGGRWLLRIEDIDPPREMPGASEHIMAQLAAYGFVWDGEVIYQSQRRAAYAAALAKLAAGGDVFWCRCSRRELAQQAEQQGHARYPGTCRAFTSPRPDAAVRLAVPDQTFSFTDRVFGRQQENLATTVGDFVIQRRDGWFAYQLAVVVDDAWQGVTDVVRGADLLDNTGRQLLLQEKLALPTPRYLHLPLALNADGSKLSKQNLAREIPLPAEPLLIWLALDFLGQQPPASLKGASAATLLDWGSAHWQAEKIPAQAGLPNPAV